MNNVKNSGYFIILRLCINSWGFVSQSETGNKIIVNDELGWIWVNAGDTEQADADNWHGVFLQIGTGRGANILSP
jgi:hypothetical protein